MRRTLAALSTAVIAIALAVPTSRAATPAAPPGGSARVVTLATGQRVLLEQAPGGQPTLGSLPASRWSAADPLIAATMRGHLYAFPRSVIPYLGNELDQSLFDVTALAGYEDASGAGRIPMSITGSAPPGVTASAPGSGYVTTASAARLGDALRTAPPAPGSRLALRGGDTTPASVLPAFDMWTLTIDTVDQNGAPAFGVLIQLVNVDDAAKYAVTTGIGAGPLKLSVPVGHYSLTAIFTTFEDGHLVFRTDVHPQFTVRRARTVVADARRATTEPSAAVGRPANLTARTLTVVRSARVHGGVGILSIDQPAPGATPATFLVSPTGKATIGELHYDTYWHYASPDAGASYTYDLDFPSDGAVPAAQSHPAHDRRLAAVQASYDSEAGTQAAAGRGILSGAGLTFVGFVALDPIAVPTDRPEYVSARPDVHWQSSVLRSTEGAFVDWFADAIRTYSPGTRPTAEWLREPIHPGVARFAEHWFAPLICPACRQGDQLNLIIEPYADNAGHVAVQPTVPASPDGSSTGSYRLSQDGTQIASGGYLDGVIIPVRAQPATYRLTYDVARSAPWWTLSTASHTEWTFRSARSGRSLPKGWFCDNRGDTDCDFLPMIFADYDLPADRSGHELPGATSATVRPFYLRPTAQPHIRTVTFDASFDGGRTWQPATVADEGAGQYRAAYRNPTAAGFASLRLVVTDSAGDRLTQVIQRAYAIG